MGKITDINHEGLKTAIIDLQVSSDLVYYGYFAMYFNFVENPELEAAAGVAVINRQFTFAYNVERLDFYEKKYGKDFFKFLIIHESKHILLGHQARAGERNKQIANIAMDMVINAMTETDHKLAYDDFYYSNRKYESPGIIWDGPSYTGMQMFEEIYDKLLADNPNVDSEGDGDGSPADGDGEDGDSKDGSGSGSGSGSGKGKKQPRLVDSHGAMQDNSKEMTTADKAIVDSMVQEIHESLQARGYSASNGIEKAFKFEKKKPIVNIFKRVFGNGKIKSSTYRRLSRRNPSLKGNRKESKDVNLILDTSGSMWADLNEIMSVVVGNYNIYLIQCDTEVKYAGHVKSLNDWKKVAMKGSGGTIMQPAIDRIIEEKRQKIQTIFVTDGYTGTLDFTGFKNEIIIVLSRNAVVPNTIGSNRVKFIRAFRD